VGYHRRMPTGLDPLTAPASDVADRGVRPAWFTVYGLVVALWAGGTAIFSFLVTPVIFRSFGRDLAGEIVGKLFPVYFPTTLCLSALALVTFLGAVRDRSGVGPRLSLALIVVALLVNGYVSSMLYPEAVAVKRQVASFERESPDSPARKQFARLHGRSMALNLFVVADGALLVLLLPSVGKAGTRRP